MASDSCRYCSTDIDTDSNEYLEHIAQEHEEELSRIDQLRLQRSDITISSEPTQKELILQTFILIVGALVSAYLFYTFFF